MYYSNGATAPLDRESVISALREGVLRISFTKADKSLRILNGTLKSEYLPPMKEEKEDSPKRKVSLETVAVFDVDKQDWRSFRLDSVVSIVPYVQEGDGILV